MGLITYNADTLTITVSGFISTEPCTLDDIVDADSANGWGVFSKLGGYLYRSTARIRLESGWVKDNNKHLVIEGATLASPILDIVGTWQFGDEYSDRLGKDGGSITIACDNGANPHIQLDGQLRLFGCQLADISPSYYGISGSGLFTAYCSIICGLNPYVEVDFNYCKHSRFYLYYGTRGKITNHRMFDTYGILWNTGNLTFENVVQSGGSGLRFLVSTNYEVTDLTYDALITWFHYDHVHTLKFYNTCKFAVCDSNGDLLPGATLTFEDTQGNVQVAGTDNSGYTERIKLLVNTVTGYQGEQDITTHIPYKLTVSKPGYTTRIEYLYIDKRIELETITLKTDDTSLTDLMASLQTHRAITEKHELLLKPWVADNRRRLTRLVVKDKLKLTDRLTMR